MSAASVCFICLSEDAPQLRVTRSSKRDNWLECDNCKNWFHAECGGYTASEYKKFSKGNWLKCLVCCLQHLHTCSYQDNTDLSSIVTEAVNKRVAVASVSDKKASVSDKKNLSGSSYRKRISASTVSHNSCCHAIDDKVTDEVECLNGSDSINTVVESQGVHSGKLDANPVCVSEAHTSDNILIIDNINNPSEFSSSKRILHEVNLFCPEVKVEYAYSLAKGGVAIHTVDKSGRDILLNKLPLESFGGGIKHFPRNRSCDTVFIKGVCTSVSVKEFTKILQSYGVDVIEVRRLLNRNTGKPLRVIKVKSSTENYSQLLSFHIVINNHKCTVEPQRSVRVIRCYNCQSFGHLARFCLNDKRCEFCSGCHLHAQCSDEIRCANCAGLHPSSSPQCPVYVSQYESLTKQHSKY